MSGTAITSCAAATIVTSTLVTSTKFVGAQFQSATGTYTPGAATVAATTTLPFFGRVGPGYAYYAKVASISGILSTATIPSSINALAITAA